MKFSAVLGAIGSGAAIFKTASTTALIVGSIYLLDCRFSSPGADSRERCWMTALPIMGLGAAGRGGYALGYGTYNPALRPEDQPPTPESDPNQVGRSPFKRR